MDTQSFLAGIQDSNADKRFAAWREAGTVSPSVIPQLGKLAASADPGLSKAAIEALTTMTHSVGKDPKSSNRAAVAQGLLNLNSATYTLPVRMHALRLASNIAGEDAVAAVAKEIGNPELREEVVYCLERIPGNASIQALLNSYKDAADDFKPRILAALGHRRAPAAAALCTDAMRSPNKEIAIAGAKAFARIGAKPAAPPSFPPEAGLSDWQKLERMDSILMYADAQAKAGNAADAMTTYKAALDHAQEHIQCAAIIGIGKLATAEAAGLLLPKLKSPLRNVRITAQKVWKGIASA